MKKDFKGGTLRILTDVPPRTFDLLPRYVEKYGYKDNLFAGKENGVWVKYNGKRFTELTDAISFGLLKLGIEKGERVAIVANSSPQWNMIDFAIQQIGAVCVPIYPTISTKEYEYIFNHSECSAVFVGSHSIYSKIGEILKHTESVKEVIAIKPIDDLRTFDQLAELGRANADRETLKRIEDSVKTDDTATIIYTSGTMGTPKGVMLSHRNIMSDFEFYSTHYLIDHRQTALSYLPLSHIYERSVQYSHVYLGCPTYYTENTGTIISDMAEVKPEHFSTVPRLIEKVYSTLLRKGRKMKGIKRMIFFWALHLAERYDETGRNNSWFYMKKIALADKLVYSEIKKVFGGNLRVIISGGASIQPRLVKLFSAMGISVIEGYGLTETSPVVCTNSMVTGKIKAGTVGVPCSNQTVKIAENGEVLVKGSNVMQGYYKDEKQTREAIDEDGFFHTNDKGSFDEDGMLKITGRLKEMFKTSMGKYVSPAPIENKISESLFIGQILVVGENQKFAGALIVPNFEFLRMWCERKKIEYTTDSEMAKKPEVVARFRKEIDKYNKLFGDYEQIKKFELLGHEWTIDAGEMTASLKLRRTVIAEKYKAVIDKLYAE